MFWLSQMAVSEVRCSTRPVALLPVKLVSTFANKAFRREKSALVALMPLRQLTSWTSARTWPVPPLIATAVLGIEHAQVIFDHQIGASGGRN